MRIKKSDRSSLLFILGEFIISHESQESIYSKDIEVAKRIIEEIK